MEGKIFVVGADGRLRPMHQIDYADEADLQSRIARYPDLLAGDQITRDDPRRWLHVAREVGVPGHEGGGGRWSIDNLFLDQDGVPTLVEVKRSADTRIRREVVGQLVEYAANVSSYWGADYIRDRFEANCEEAAREPEALVSELMEEDTEFDYEDFWERVSTNLQTGRLRLLFVADKIPPELRRIVEFLNEQMRPAEVLAVELRQFASADQKALVPNVMGLTSKGEAKRARDRNQRQWDEDSFLANMETRHGREAARLAQRLLHWVEPRVSRIWWGKGKSTGSFVPVISADDVWYGLFRCTAGRPAIEMYFAMFQSRDLLNLEDCTDIKNRLNHIDGVHLDRAKGYPKFDLLALGSDESFNVFTAIVEEIIGLIEERHERPK